MCKRLSERSLGLQHRHQRLDSAPIRRVRIKALDGDKNSCESKQSDDLPIQFHLGLTSVRNDPRLHLGRLAASESTQNLDLVSDSKRLVHWLRTAWLDLGPQGRQLP